MSVPKFSPIDRLEIRLMDLHDWLESALEASELRDEATIAAAKRALLRWACVEVGDRKRDTDLALAYFLESYIESQVRWADRPGSLAEELELEASPEWDLVEFHLLVASFLADLALNAFQKGTKEQLALAAMLYADAVEAREHWSQSRGPAGARNPNTNLGRLHKISLELDELVAGRKARHKVAKQAARARHEKDPKRLAKAGALDLWLEWQAGKHTKLRTVQNFAMEVMRRWPVLKSSKVIEQWSATWTKARKEGRAPAC